MKEGGSKWNHYFTRWIKGTCPEYPTEKISVVMYKENLYRNVILTFTIKIRISFSHLLHFLKFLCYWTVTVKSAITQHILSC